ncbi:MAG: chalcone isomerase family protein [Alphaproteobacteria bacterium]|nr:chalcone isomerase family protein [Alphaproteobacteria bacterium]
MLLCSAPPAAACEMSFPRMIEVGGTALFLNGQGWRVVSPWGIRAYAAALYQPTLTTAASEALRLGRSWAVEMVYCREASAAAIREACLTSLRANCRIGCVLDGDATDAFLATLADARPKTRWRFVFDGGNLKVHEDQVLRGGIAGPAFARVLLETWIGRVPPTTDLREALLGHKQR